ncbi:MAG: DUF885 domain-containing protein [Coriobacteriia bacterium]|nr:DUF885 domain-containing protein [Coriobacteriia bacterium]
MRYPVKKPPASSQKPASTRLLAVLLAFVMLLSTLSGCGVSSNNRASQGAQTGTPIKQEQVNFSNAGLRPVEEIGDELFAFICDDYVCYHQFVADPQSFHFDKGFTKPDPRFGDITFEAAEEEYALYHRLMDELDTYSFSALNSSEQRLYNYIAYYLSNALELEPYFYLRDPYQASVGVQIDLPLTLMIYPFRTRQDIDDYLSLVADIPRIFDQANAITQERTARGLFSNLSSVEDAIDEAKVYTDKTADNLLVISFEAALNSKEAPFDSLTEAERKQYQETNRDLIKNKVAPAFLDAIKQLEKVATLTSYEVTLANQPGGKEYYAAKLHLSGFRETPEKMIDTLDDAMISVYMTFFTSSVFVDFDERESIAKKNLPKDATGIIEYFNTRVGEDFPDIGTRPFVVDAASDDEVISMFTAFYLMAPVDDLTENRMKYYPQNIRDHYDLGKTLAHESFPGHLYQYNYFGLTNPHPIEMLVDSTAYAEGYAVYSEYYALLYMGFTAEEAQAIYAFDLLMRVLQARLDLGVNYEGWDVWDMEAFLDGWGMGDYAEELFCNIAASPTVSVPYGLGPLEFFWMLRSAQSILGDAFDLKEFHAAILDNGGVHQTLLEKNFTRWLYDTKRRS